MSSGRDEIPNSNLPSPVTPLIGREEEINELSELMLKPETRLVTLLGPGGVGKTRLALAVAATLSPAFSGRVFLINLAHVNKPELVLSSITRALELKETGDAEGLLSNLPDFLSTRPTLFVLDNFEQVAEASPLLQKLLDKVPSLKLLVTSQIALSVPGAPNFMVRPLPVSDPEKVISLAELAEVPSLALFMERARLVQPEFQLTSQNRSAVEGICRKLDGLPLALELAAARIKTLSPQALLSRLDHSLKILGDGPRDWPVQQQTMRATIEWSYNSLNPAEKTLFSRLGVFSGSWTLEAARAICRAKRPEFEAEISGQETVSGSPRPNTTSRMGSLFQSLNLKSLVQQVEGQWEKPRYSLLGPVREYALDQLESRGEVPARLQKHALYYLSLAEEASRELEGPEQASWLNKLRMEYPNLRSALEWFKERAQEQVAMLPGSQTAAILATNQLLRFGVALTRFWQIAGYLNEGKGWLLKGLSCAEEILAKNTLNKSKAILNLRSLQSSAMSAAGALASETGDYNEAWSLLINSLEWQREEGGKAPLVRTLSLMGKVAVCRGDYQSAVTFYEESLHLFQNLDDQKNRIITLGKLAEIQVELGELERAGERYSEVLPLFQDLGLTHEVAGLLNGYGELLLNLHNFQEAQPYFEKSLLMQRTLGDRAGSGRTLTNLGELERRRGDLEKANSLFREALDLLQKSGDKTYTAVCLEKIAWYENETGNPRRAARFCGAARAVRESVQARHDPVEIPHFQELLNGIRSKLEQDDYREAWAEGHDFPLPETIKLTFTPALGS